MSMTVVTKKGKYAKYRYEAFSALASMTFELLRKNGVLKEITSNRANVDLFTFDSGNIGFVLDWVDVYFKGTKIGSYSLYPTSSAYFRIFVEDYRVSSITSYLDEKQAQFFIKQLSKIINVKEMVKGRLCNQHLNISQKGILYYLGYSESEEYEYTWGNPELPED